MTGPGLRCRVPAVVEALEGRRAHRDGTGECGGTRGGECYTCWVDFADYDRQARALLAPLVAARAEERALVARGGVN